MALLKKRSAAKKEVNLDEMVASGPSGAYEALQLYRSRAIRCKAKNDFKGAITGIAAGAACLLKHSHVTAGHELAIILVEMIDEEKKDIDAELRAIIYDVDDSYPEKTPQQIEFLKACVRWTTNRGNREMGDPQIHVRLANCMWTAGDKHAISHYATGEAPEALATRLNESYSTPEQMELKIRGLTLGVLHFLAFENLRDANELMDAFKKTLRDTNQPLPTSELLEFLEYLLETCRRDAQPLFKSLVTKYASALDYDEAAPALLMGPIGQRLFNIPVKVNPVMSMLQNMLT